MQISVQAYKQLTTAVCSKAGELIALTSNSELPWHDVVDNGGMVLNEGGPFSTICDQSNIQCIKPHQRVR